MLTAIKKRIKITMGTLIVLFGTTVWATNDCKLGLLNGDISPAPAEYLKDGTVKLTTYNIATKPIPAKDGFGDPTCEFSIQLAKIGLKDNLLSNLVGEPSEIKDYFDVSYDAATKNLVFVQKADIPVDWQSNMTVTVDILEQSTPAQSANGFTANIVGNSSALSTHTYTTSIAPVANNDENNISGEKGGVAIENITSNDTINGKAVTLGKDVSITKVTNNTPLEINTTTGKVTVPAGTAPGTYEETYTECNTVYKTKCNTATVKVKVEGELSKPTVTIIEDTNNDGNISMESELKGKIDVNITLPTDAKIGDTLTIINPDGTKNDVSVTQNMIDKGYTKTYPVPTAGDTITIKAILKDAIGNLSQESSDSATLIDDRKPETPEITSMDDNTSNNVTTENKTPEIKGTCTAGLTVTVQIDGGAIAPTTTCKSNGTFSMVPTQPIADGEHNVTAIQIGKNDIPSNTSLVDTLKIVTILPDYGIALRTVPTELGKGTTSMSMKIQITEYNTGKNKNTLIISIPKDTKLKLNLDSSSTSEWEMTETQDKYKLEYIGNGGKYPPHSRKYINLSGEFIIPNNKKDNFILRSIIGQENGEANFKNNEDSDTINYNSIDN